MLAAKFDQPEHEGCKHNVKNRCSRICQGERVDTTMSQSVLRQWHLEHAKCAGDL